MMTDVAFVVGPACAEDHLDGISRLYVATFSASPFVWSGADEHEHRAMLARIRRDPTFDMAMALHAGTVIGFAYGHRLPADHGWWNDFPTALPPDLTAEWDGRTFALVDLAVEASWRRLGVGDRLLGLLLGRRTEERAILSVQPTAVDAQTFYRRLGWCRVGRKGPMPDVHPPYWDIFVRTL